MPRWATTTIAKSHGSNQIGNEEKKNKMMFVNLDGFRTEGLVAKKKKMMKKTKRKKRVVGKGFFDLEKMTSSFNLTSKIKMAL